MNNEYDDKELLPKFQLALLLSAAGDSLGWPQEFAWRKPDNPIESYVQWKKLVGGRYWGYEDVINPGDYSDDTQLTLSVARSINTSGRFVPEHFAYLELPLWLNYERGGGGSVKAASRNIRKKAVTWDTNFYNTGRYNYRNAGANGAAMRNLPIALVNIHNEERFIIDTFKNSIITHGHPRAIIGSILIGGAQLYFVNHDRIYVDDLQEYITHLLHSSMKVARNDDEINYWLGLQNSNSAFEKLYETTLEEAECYMKSMKKYLSRDEKEYFNLIRAFDRRFKGSGVSTTVGAIYLTLKYMQEPEIALIKAANMVGSDTDTIASFTGSLVGVHDIDILDSRKIRNLIFQLQDYHYFKDIGKYLWEINFGDSGFIEEKTIDKTEAFLKIMAWEIGLHEMFWEILEEGDRVIHPTLGKGVIINKREKDLRRNDYVAKIVKMKFDIGQTVYFHSRVSRDGVVTESMSKELQLALS